MAIGGKVMKMTTKSSMGAGQEMRKGSKTTTAARAGEKTKNPQEMITTVMLYTVMMMRKMPEQTTMDHRWAGCRTLIFKSCFSSRRITQELPPERKPRWINLS